MTRGQDPALDLPNTALPLLKMCLPNGAPGSRGEGSIVSKEQGADINVIRGKKLLGFCSSEKYLSLK